MNNFLKIYKESCNNEVSKYGFKNCKNNYYRVVNDVLQTFLLHQSIYGYDCTIEFGITPLCYEIGKNYKSSLGGKYTLRMFEGGVEWWEYDKKSEESIKDCINNLMSYIKKYLIPFFERGTDCKNAYNEVSKLDEILQKRWPERKESDLLDYRKFCMLLKMGEYDKAVIILKAIETQNVFAYNDNLSRGNTSPEYIKRIEEKLSELRRKINYISKKDMSYINDFIQVNEQYSLRNLLESNKSQPRANTTKIQRDS